MILPTVLHFWLVFVFFHLVQSTFNASENTCAPNNHSWWAPHPENCRKFYVCENGEPISEEQCVGNFDYIFGRCREIGVARCFPGLGVDIPCTELNDGRKIPDTNICKNYYQCNGTEKISYECTEPDEYFDFKLSSCDRCITVACYPGSLKSGRTQTASLPCQSEE